ncbi:CapA family protein [Tissierella sp. Yu-01]|uniref:CapA family protein n=1 Tax=Tissierella sp. Yu-01 TaxID=3035694 RepID=UPI00240E6E90|nr:CapA family protein [Tissierella sp. Yu-01]WFA10312.1 CapA family protein [Tissierella sp. Yu-01]
MRKSLLLFTLLIFLVAIFGITALSFIPYGNEITADNIMDEPLEVVEPLEVPVEIIVPIETKAKILAVGDIMFHMPQINAAKTTSGNFDFNPVFKHVKKYIEDADLALGNFETVTVGDEMGFSGFPRFNSPVDTISALKNTGFDILSTANNHSLDRGKNGIINTIDVMNNNGIRNIGTFKDNTRPLIIEEINDIRIGLLSYTTSLNGLDSLLSKEDSYMVNKFDEKIIIEDINQLKAENVDIIVAYLHWGYEYFEEPTEYQRELGRKILEWGVDIVLGSHPHRIQKTEMINIDGNGKLIVYSMGNFLSNQRYETMGKQYTEDGVIVEITLNKNFDTNVTNIEEVIFRPTWVYRFRNEDGLNYEILPISDILADLNNQALPNNVIDRMQKSYNDTLSTMSYIDDIRDFKSGNIQTLIE